MYFYIAREGISILENLGQLDVPFPTTLTKVLTQLQEKGESKTNGPSV
jgi:phage-related holin